MRKTRLSAMIKSTDRIKGGKGQLTRLQSQKGMEYVDSFLVISELRESEERFRHAFDFAGTGMAILSTDGRWLRANHAICDMLGYTEDELRQTTYLELTHPEDLLYGREDVRQVLSGELAYMQVEKRYRHRDGYYLWTKLTTSVVRSEQDEPLYFISQIENIDQRKHAEQDVSLLSFAINRVRESIYLIDENAHFKYVNDEACQELEYGRDELLDGMGVLDIDPDFKVENWSKHWQLLKENKSMVFDSRHRTKTGRILPVEVSANPIEYQGRSYHLAIVRNISERKRAEQARRQAEADLREQEERFRQMTENMEEVVWLADVIKKQVLYVSPAYEAIWGASCDSLYANPKQWVDAVHPNDRNKVEALYLNHQVNGGYDIEYRIIRPDGSLRYIHDRAFPVRIDEGESYRITGIAQDITTRKEQEAHIQYLAYHDVLTGLPNRALVMDRLDQAIAQAHQHQEILAVLFLDLDRFKTINDTLGHPAGDLLLQQAGNCLAQTLREEDTIGRFGGDEFLILLPHLAAPEDAANVADRVLSSLSSPFKVADYELHVRASIGISIYPRDANNTETLVKYADAALYLAKEQGRNTFRFFSPELDISGRARLYLENDLRSAVDKNQLYLLYQPLMDVDSGQYIGAEALLRWQHPEFGLVSPDDFIPIAEETGLIIPIGEWVLRSACLQARAWQDEGRDNFRVSVNLSRRQLERCDLTATLRKILDETGCPPQLLELEITESSTMSEPEQAIVRLQALKEMGIGLALDDYGTGYSSLAYLKRFPLDRLKIDRSFVAGIPEDGDDMAIVQTTIVLARQLRLKVVAEGVETQAQRSLLESLGCDEIQGYLIGRPEAPIDLTLLR